MSDFKVSSEKHLNSLIPLDDAQESALWLAFRQGDKSAFADLVNFKYPLLLNYGIRLEKDREFVKDCLHDLFIDLWNSKHKLNDVICIRAYLLKSLRRKLFRESRKLSWFREAKEITDDYSFEVQFAIETYLIENEIHHEDLKKLKVNLGKLTKRQREAIYLRFYQEMEYDEIAEVMSIHYHSAVNLIHEGLKLLRKNWFLSSILSFSLYLS